MNTLKKLATHPLIWVALVATLAVGVLYALGGALSLISSAYQLGGGMVMSGATLIAAVPIVMLALYLAWRIRGIASLNDPVFQLINSDPIASAIVRGLYAVGLFIMAGLIMGFAPMQPVPAAWPDARFAEPSPVTSPVRPALPGRMEACEDYREDAENAVRRHWGEFQYPDAWLAQIWQESLCDPFAVSPVGARGLAQFMPATWIETRERLGLPYGASPHDDIAVDAGAYYQARQMFVWRGRDRPLLERWRLGLASYNAGAGNIINAQSACGGARDWRDIAPCLHLITGHHAAETRSYVPRIERHWRDIAAADPTRAPAEIRGVQ